MPQRKTNIRSLYCGERDDARRHAAPVANTHFLSHVGRVDINLNGAGSEPFFVRVGTDDKPASIQDATAD